jgi:RNase adapter protein RapZ
MQENAEDGGAGTRLALITGMSGAGNSTAIRALEDLGFEAIDNLPLSFLKRLFPPGGGATGEASQRPVAVGIDVRTRGFSAEAFLARLDALRAAPDVASRLVFLDCSDEALIDRFKTTRRRHPLAPAEGAAIGIAREREALQPLREHADLTIDTTDLTPHELKARLSGLFGDRPGAHGLAVQIQSFSYKRGVPREADWAVDCRFLRNPYWEPELRAADGRVPEVAAHVTADPMFAPFLDRLAELTSMLLPAYEREGKAYFTLALGCSGGRHRSVAAAEALARRLSEDGWPARIRHRELDERNLNV